MDRVVCLIENTADGKLQVNTEATAILSGIRQPVVVVAIVGLYRTGKSYLMNKLAGSQKGFDLGSTVQAQTKGIWMRCLPHPTRDGHTLVLLDTEGLGDVEKGDKKNDMWIFCLSILLSSALVYNSKAVIDEDAIEKLHYVGEMAELIKVKSKDNDDDEAEYSSHFPIFIWAVRDVTLKLEFNGKPISEDEYLENALMLHTANGTQESKEKVERHNRYRDCIRMYFKSRKCFMFDLPTGNKEVLQNMDEVSDGQLSPAFVAQTKKFCDYVYNKAEVKYVDDTHKVTGESLAALANMYTNAISSSNAACMEDMVSNISVAENTAAVKEAKEHYERRMNEKVTFPTETLDQMIELSEECEKEALKIFIKRSFKDKDRKFHQQYLGIIEHKKSEFFKRNEVESRTHCENLIKSLSKDLEDSLQQGAYIKLGGYRLFKEEMERIEDQYKKAPRKGTKADEVFQEFKKSKEMLSSVIMSHDKTLSDRQKKEEEEKANKEKLEQQRRMEEKQRNEENKKQEHQRRIVEEHFRGVLEKEQLERRLLQERLQIVEQEKARENFPSDTETTAKEGASNKNPKERDRYRSQGCEEHAEMYQMQIDDTRGKQKEAASSGWGPLVVSGLTAAAFAVFPPSAVLAGATIFGVGQMFR